MNDPLEYFFHQKEEDRKNFCKEYINKYVSYVSIEALESEVLKSRKERRVSFGDQLAAIGGTLGLFLGMSIISAIEIICFLFKMSGKGSKACFNVLFRKKKE